MRLIAVTTAALAALTLAACQQNEADTDEAAMSAEDAAMDANATTADGGNGYGASGATGSGSGGSGSGASSASGGGQGGSGAAAQRTNDPALEGYVSDPRGPRLADGSYADGSYGDARDTAQSDAEQTNLRPRPDVTGPQ